MNNETVGKIAKGTKKVLPWVVALVCAAKAKRAKRKQEESEAELQDANTEITIMRCTNEMKDAVIDSLVKKIEESESEPKKKRGA